MNRISLNDNITRENNILIIKKCDHAKCASDFLRQLREVVERGYTDVIIKSEAISYFPNVCVPIAGIIDFYRNKGIEFISSIAEDHYLIRCGVFAPYKKDRNELQKEKTPFDKIFSYETSGQVADITQAYIDSISHQSLCEEGVLSGLIWCISEVMDNVLLHSLNKFGFVMAQYHPKNKHVAFCIYDYGVGIYKTMKESIHKPQSEIDAISLAIQEGVGDGTGQGNGLYGLFQTVCNNGGRLTITSGASSLMLLQDGEIKKLNMFHLYLMRTEGLLLISNLILPNRLTLKKYLHQLAVLTALIFVLTICSTIQVT